MTRLKTQKKFVFQRREPDLPKELPVADDPALLLEAHEISLAERSIQGIRLEGRAASSLRLESCVLEGVNLANSRFGSILCKDVRFIRCDLANLETRYLTLTRVEFVDCRMTGLRAGEAECQDVLLSGGDQRYCQFRFSRFKSAEFDTCNFAEADFQGTDLTGSIFRKCTLHNAEMSKAKLVNADLRGSLIDGMQLNADDVRGALVDPSQAMILASLLGIQIG